MKKYLIQLMLALSITNFTFAQNEKAKIKVYLLGTFHFAQTDSAYEVLTEKNQKSIAKLCDIIKKQKPDKIIIERMPDFEHINKMDSLYQAFKKGDSLQRRNEIWQVALRVAKELNHQTIYSCDHPGQYGYFYSQIEEYARANNQIELLNGKGKGITILKSSLLNEDSLLMHSELLAYLRWMNSIVVQKSSHAHYINHYPQFR